MIGPSAVGQPPRSIHDQTSPGPFAVNLGTAGVSPERACCTCCGTTRSRARPRTDSSGLEPGWRRWFNIDRCRRAPIPVYSCSPMTPSAEFATPRGKVEHRRDDSEDPRRGSWPPLGCPPSCQRSLHQSHWNHAFQHAAPAPTRESLYRLRLQRCPRLEHERGSSYIGLSTP